MIYVIQWIETYHFTLLKEFNKFQILKRSSNLLTAQRKIMQ